MARWRPAAVLPRRPARRPPLARILATPRPALPCHVTLTPAQAEKEAAAAAAKAEKEAERAAERAAKEAEKERARAEKEAEKERAKVGGAAECVLC